MRQKLHEMFDPSDATGVERVLDYLERKDADDAQMGMPLDQSGWNELVNRLESDERFRGEFVRIKRGKFKVQNRSKLIMFLSFRSEQRSSSPATH